MKWIDSVLGRPPQLPDTAVKPQLAIITPPEEVFGWIAVEIDSDRLCLGLEARKALAKVTAAVARQDRRMVGK
jgi:hypothetical protein